MRRGLPAALLLLPVLAHAAPQPLIARTAHAAIAAAELPALLATIPPESRDAVASDPARLAALLRDVLLQRELLARAHQSGFDHRPDTVAKAEAAARAATAAAYLDSLVPPAAPPTEAELLAAWRQAQPQLMQPRLYHLAQIFLAVRADAPATQSDALRARLDAMRARIAGGTQDFAAAARTASQDTRSAGQGGDLGWLRQDALAEPVRGAVAGLAEGGLSPVLRTQDGWHLVRLLATRAAGPLSLEQSRPVLLAAIARDRTVRARQLVLDNLLQADPVRIDTAALARLTQPPPTR